jgi:LuxR family transcriptional regulator/LuxR family quorum-sensing system transcriptional regulator CciR
MTLAPPASPSPRALSRVLQDIAACATPREIWHTALDHFHACGILRVSYHLYAPPGFGHDSGLALAADGFPDTWVQAYTEERLYLIDPIPALAKARSTPFLWSDADTLGDLGPAARRYLDRLTAQGLGDGLAVQVFGPGGRDGYVGLGFGGPPPRTLDAAAMRAHQLVAQAGHLRYCDLAPVPAAETGLSPRETEVLGWIARGKSNAVIAELMGISPHTVDTHVRGLFDKLGVADRVTAALRGVGAALLQFHAAEFD